MRAAVIQMNSTADKARNLERARRLVAEAASAGAELAVLPEKWNYLSANAAEGAEELASSPTLAAAAGWAREHSIDLIAGSIAERVEGSESSFNTSCLIDRQGELVASYRKLHMFDVEVDGVSYRESDHERAGDAIVGAEAAGVQVGMTVCYDLRFPELYRILAVRGARVLTVPSAFTLPTGRDHWHVLLRARAIENQAFVLAANQVGKAPPHYESYGHSLIADPWGTVLAEVEDGEGVAVAELDLERQDQIRASLPSLANRRSGAYRWPEAVRRLMAKAPPVDRRRQILDAAVRVFARQGFNACRVSDIAREANVAYGLVYHYFDSKDEVLNELFVERWSLLLQAIEEIDSRPVAPREKLDAVAGFIIDSYRHDPELMKVIIIEVTRAANSFTRTHLPEIRQAYDLIAKIVRDAQSAGVFRADVDPDFASMWFYGAIEQLLTGWVFEIIPHGDGDFERARTMVVETICGGLERGAPESS